MESFFIFLVKQDFSGIKNTSMNFSKLDRARIFSSGNSFPPPFPNWFIFFFLKPPGVFLRRSFRGIFLLWQALFRKLLLWAVCFLSSNEPNCLVLKQL